MKFHVITLFPEVIDSYTQASILGRAQKDKKLEVKSYQLRDFVANPVKGTKSRTARKWFYKRVDDKAYGGGPGMVLQAEPVIRAVESIAKKISHGKNTTIYRSVGSIKNKKVKILITAAGGKPLTNAYAKKLSKEKEVIIVCGRYEGIDARAKKIINSMGANVEEISVGPYILTGGEVPALAIIDATARQIPGVLGKLESLEEGRVASHEVYTRPEILTHRGIKYRVPKVLLSGHRAKIDAFRSKSRSKTQLGS